jgi:ABC-type polysaccharide/polyol phosphate export permease
VLDKFKQHKNKFVILAIIIIGILSMQLPWQYFIDTMPLKLQVYMKIDHDDVIQIFYATDERQSFDELNSVKVNIKASENYQIIKFDLPVKDLKQVRIDTGNSPGRIEIKDITLKYFSKDYTWDPKSIITNFQPSPDVGNLVVKDDALTLKLTGNDSFLASGDISRISKDIKFDNSMYLYMFVILFIILICAAFVVFVLYRRIFDFLGDIFRSRRLIFELAKKDLQNRYLGSNLGIIWAFIQPAITILIFWFVFQVGFKSAPVGNFPFILWLICGMIPWFFFSESFMSATNSVLDNSYLVKKIVFRVSILPIIRIVSSLFIHLFFVIIIFVMFILYGYMPSIYNLQVIYYLFATIILVLGLSWITSSLVIFLRDLGQIIGILIQFGFWMTPIFWTLKTVPEKYQFILKLNPVYYLIEGYRDSFINHSWFWEHYNLTVNFWFLTGMVFFAGVLLFKRLRPHFADVL